MSADKFTKAQHLSLFIRDLKVHPTVQRELRPAWAREIRDNFDPDKFGEIAVVKNGDDYYVFDGQHRKWAAGEALGENQRVPCIVYAEMPVDRQAELFLGRNASKSVRALDKFKVAVLAKRPAECRVEHIVSQMGVKIGQQYAAGIVRSPAALLKVFTRWGEGTLMQTISVIRTAWPREADAYDGVIIRGVGYLLHHFAGEIEEQELARKLARSGGPNRMLGSARDWAKMHSIATERAAAEYALNIYNKGRRHHLAFGAAKIGSAPIKANGKRAAELAIH